VFVNRYIAIRFQNSLDQTLVFYSLLIACLAFICFDLGFFLKQVNPVVRTILASHVTSGVTQVTQDSLVNQMGVANGNQVSAYGS